ncbi:MAG: hypothetical protein GY930_07445 [bacterium]|nr:hypothetical protein [bacterium]
MKPYDNEPQQRTIVEVQPEWALESEPMGTKDKVWYRVPVGDGQPLGAKHLFKRSREATGEHWAEVIAADVAEVLGIDHAEYKLARLGEDVGVSTKSFISSGQELIHGNQILARQVHGYAEGKMWQQADHTFANIMDSMNRVFSEEQHRIEAMRQLCEFLVLDAVIGNTDRHHENWGVVRERAGDGFVGFVAPSFDHASSLGRELVDEGTRQACRVKILRDGHMHWYAEDKARGAVYWSSDSKHCPSPVSLVQMAASDRPELFDGALKSLSMLDRAGLEVIVSKIPDGWMTDLAREFALELMCYNLDRLRALAK